MKKSIILLALVLLLSFTFTIPIKATNGMDLLSSHSNKKMAYLTFDDGPSINTIPILNILDEYNIKATFFVMANNSSYAKSGYKEMMKRGHTVALHTYSHDFSKIYRTKESYFSDLGKLEKFLEDHYNLRTKMIRFPGGSKNKSSRQYGSSHLMRDIIEELDSKGYTYYDWNIDSKDGISPSISENTIITSVLNGAKNKNIAVILLHDINSMKNTVRALPDLIEGLKEQGYVFDVISPNIHEFKY
ncbi:polysaccharide deacetylase family protein [Peribacillus tepidiphilus]|uniref:polysaccharide deacetylase family protein n=1 Tax=Peribacillus tepidiphilus TaxID=2652445 RepID=UPI00129098A9|nr:polysaccharide deacetylase family protein [Peribacillus tepidiphilus]